MIKKIPMLCIGIFFINNLLSSDSYDSYPSGSVTDPEGPETGYFRSDRGGSWINFYPSLLRSANRFYRNPKYEYNFLGFRMALVPVK